MSAEIQRLKHLLANLSANIGSQTKKFEGFNTIPQKYLFSVSLQIKASQGVLCGHSSVKLTGQGSAAQHTPQPLQGSPSVGFTGASA